MKALIWVHERCTWVYVFHSARIVTALFSHRARSHSSSALCARVPVCGGTSRMKGLSGSVEDGRFVIAATARKMSPSLMS